MPPLQPGDDVVDAAQQFGLDEVPVVIGNAEIDEDVTATAFHDRIRATNGVSLCDACLGARRSHSLLRAVCRCADAQLRRSVYAYSASHSIALVFSRICPGLDAGAVLHQAFEGLVDIEQHAVGQHSAVVVGQDVEGRA